MCISQQYFEEKKSERISKVFLKRKPEHISKVFLQYLKSKENLSVSHLARLIRDLLFTTSC